MKVSVNFSKTPVTGLEIIPVIIASLVCSGISSLASVAFFKCYQLPFPVICNILLPFAEGICVKKFYNGKMIHINWFLKDIQ